MTGPNPGRWELVRALGTLTMVAPAQSSNVARSLGVAPLSAATYTELFVLSCPPFAAVHLGPEGKLGGEGADRVAGLWRTLGLDVPNNADHLGVLLALYAELGEAEDQSAHARTRARLSHARRALFWEYLWSWVPGYLEAVAREDPDATPWADLCARVLIRESALTSPATSLPIALRDAPRPLDGDGTLDELLDAVIAPVRVGFVLTHGDLRRASKELGVGLRRGERRYVLRAMMEQDAASTLTWLGAHALEWREIHRQRPRVDHDPGAWWMARARASAAAFAHVTSVKV